MIASLISDSMARRSASERLLRVKSFDLPWLTTVASAELLLRVIVSRLKCFNEKMFKYKNAQTIKFNQTYSCKQLRLCIARSLPILGFSFTAGTRLISPASINVSLILSMKSRVVNLSPVAFSSCCSSSPSSCWSSWPSNFWNNKLIYFWISYAHNKKQFILPHLLMI